MGCVPIKLQVATAVMLFVTGGLLFASGCTTSVTKMTAKGIFEVKITGQGRILKNGRNEVILKVANEKGKAVEGAQIEITPWMPEHGHGTPWPPTVTAQGQGTYKAIIPIMMAGTWELRIKVKKGELEDTVLFNFTAL